MNEKIYEIFYQSKLSEGIGPQCYPSIFSCLHADIKKFQKDSLIFDYDEPINRMAVIISAAALLIFLSFNLTAVLH